MSIAEGVQARVTLKEYASGAITSNALAVSSTDLIATGGQVLRRVSSNLELKTDYFPSQEIREDQQDVDARQGSQWVEGSISGEWSPGTYADIQQASFRGTWAAVVTGDESDYTSVAASASGKTITFASGDPAADGFGVGKVMRLSSASEAANNGVDFTILSWGGSGNRTATVFPAPTDMSADTEFDVTTVGKSLILPTTQATNVNRKFGIEHHFGDLDKAKLFTECRFGGFNFNLPASGNCTFEALVRGRSVETYEGGSAPFFSGPDPETTTGILAAVNGLLTVGGTAVGVITGIQGGMNRNLESTAVIGQPFHPEIHVQKAVVTGQISGMVQDFTFLQALRNETELQILAWLKTSSSAAAPSVTVLMPRVKLSNFSDPLQGGAAQMFTANFTALRYVGAGVGIPSTTMQIVDSEVA